MTRQFPSKTYGAVSENICVAYFSYLGYQVSKPICDDSRYDFLIDDGNSIKKVQCKTSITKDNKTYPTIDLVPKRRKGGYKIGDFDLLWILTSIGIFLMESEDVPKEMRPEIVKMHNNGVPTSVIADIIGISAHAVGEALRASGIYKRSRYNKHALDEKTRESIYHLKQSGTPISEIPDILNLGPYTKLDTSEAH